MHMNNKKLAVKNKHTSVFQAIVNLHSEGNSNIAALKRTVDHLFTREDLGEDARHLFIKKIKNVEEEWKTTLQQAQELHRFDMTILYLKSNCTKHC